MKLLICMLNHMVLPLCTKKRELGDAIAAPGGADAPPMSRIIKSVTYSSGYEQ
jgi:hypothetical protein